MNTIDGQLVWRQKAEQGSDLEDIFAYLSAHDRVPRWDEFFRAASADGANLTRLARTVGMAVAMAYEPRIAAAICEKLQFMPRYVE